MIIYGYRTIVRQLAMITMVCVRCNSYAPQQVNRRVKKFTLFFIPLFPISVWYFTRCTACGKDHLARKATMEGLLAQNGLALNGQPLAPTQQPYHPAPQFPAPQQQYPPQQYPAQQYAAPQYPAAQTAAPQQYPAQPYPAPQYAAPRQPYGTAPR
jgi:hypothetical protein